MKATIELSVRTGEPVDSDTLVGLLNDGYEIVDAMPVYEGANYGGDRPEHVGYKLVLERTQ